MKRTIEVGSHREGDALVRVLDVPALKAVHVVTGTLLELDEDVRAVVLDIARQSLQLARNGHEPRPVAMFDDRDDLGNPGSSGE